MRQETIWILFWYDSEGIHLIFFKLRFNGDKIIVIQCKKIQWKPMLAACFSKLLFRWFFSDIFSFFFFFFFCHLRFHLSFFFSFLIIQSDKTISVIDFVDFSHLRANIEKYIFINTKYPCMVYFGAFICHTMFLSMRNAMYIKEKFSTHLQFLFLN